MRPDDESIAISEDEARRCAALSLPSCVASGVPFTRAQLSSATWWNLLVQILRVRPVEIFDFTGRRLFRDFAIPWSEGAELRVRVPVFKSLGTPVFAVGIQRRAFPLAEWISEAKLKFDESGKEGPDLLVCHSYPRLGLIRNNEWLIEFGAGRVERVAPENSWSILDSIPEEKVKNHVEEWIVCRAQLERMAWNNQIDFLAAVARARQEETGNTLELPMDPQDDEWSCVPATGAMILQGYHRVKAASEDFLRSLMKTQTGIGTDFDDEIFGYQEIGGKQFEIVPIRKVSWEIARAELRDDKRGLPFKGGVEKGRKHARAVRGWRVYSGMDQLLFNDPWDSGGTYFENWTKYVHTDFVFVRPVKRSKLMRKIQDFARIVRQMIGPATRRLVGRVAKEVPEDSRRFKKSGGVEGTEKR